MALSFPDEDEKQQQSISLLLKSIQQQQLCPAIRPFAQEPFQTLHSDLEDQRAKIRILIRNRDDLTPELKFKYMIYSTEIEKLGYLLKLYLKTRLKKIHKFCFYLTKNPKQASELLSQQQYLYLKKYAELRWTYLQKECLSLMPGVAKDFAGLQPYFDKPPHKRQPLVLTNQSQVQVVEPNKDQFCFVKIIRNRKNLRYGIDVKVQNATNDGRNIPISEGDILFIPYGRCQELFDVDQFELI